MICPICNIREIQQTHHLSYDPEITIEVCLECHRKLHLERGVGRPKISLVPERNTKQTKQLKLLLKTHDTWSIDGELFFTSQLKGILNREGYDWFKGKKMQEVTHWMLLK